MIGFSCLFSTVFLFWILYTNNIAAFKNQNKYCPLTEHLTPSPCENQCFNDTDCEPHGVCCTGGCKIEEDYIASGMQYYNTCFVPDFCKKGVCKNGGICILQWNGYECKCKKGFTGVNCTTRVYECAKVPPPCTNNGVCKDLIGDYKCCCPPGFIGKNCNETETNEECKDSKYDMGSCSDKTCKKYPKAYCVMKPVMVLLEDDGTKRELTDDECGNP